MCSKPIFCSKIALKGKTCSRLLKPQKVAPNAKSCSKVAEHNRDRPKRRHKLDGIGVRRIRTFPFLLIPFTTPSLRIQWKLGCRSRKQKRKNKPITRLGIEHCDWFILPLLLATPTMQFSLDRKRRSHQRTRYSASDSVGSIFTRSYRFSLPITTPTTTPSLVKTSI